MDLATVTSLIVEAQYEAWFWMFFLHPVFWNWTCRAKGQIWFRNRGSKLFSNIVKHTLSRLWAVPPAVAVPASQWSADLSGSKFRFVKSTHFTQLKSCCIHYDLKLVMDPIGRDRRQVSWYENHSAKPIWSLHTLDVIWILSNTYARFEKDQMNNDYRW